MHEILLIDKPAEWTSFDVVNKIRRIVADKEGKKPKNVKVGHAGTLDPFATGLLIVLVGKENTRKAQEYSKLDKTYEVTMQLGEVSSTGDPEGEITSYCHPDRSGGISLENKVDGISRPARDDIEKALDQFVGEIEQTPPAYSAIKVNGQRAYKLAREGKEVQLEPRKIRINRLELTAYNYPEVKFVADVSSGTYIRSLVEDLGRALGSGAYTSQLRRTKIGDFSIANAETLDHWQNRIQ